MRHLTQPLLKEAQSLTVHAPGRSVFETLKDFKAYQDAKRISIYLAMPAAEVQTDAIVRHALGTGKQVFVPYLYKSTLSIPDSPARIMDMVHLKSIQDYESLARDKWNIPSIDPSTVPNRERILGGDAMATLDLMLVPGVAFDTDVDGSLRRLGHGKGFYDFFLNRYFAGAAEEGGKGSSLRLIALGLKEQLLDETAPEEIPMGFYDRKLHGLILGDGNIIESPNSQ